ncbi:DMT family transporter [Orrella dioscoreae]|uniref:Permease of the drug/metabolite transporter (DMT) superfamily n=1 Tax=Orrella dioscoreae TaxID=1851544 RepID=A0A1C3K2Z0_9BURK|nr:DMT family transporter [Orrella dioscoreae]SBT25737.1 Permease of the drug/metabolite transporter (DMT) superfamily [Orrella dioscoreae]SOE52075.1 Permease of the drug/metabolite transporter (DMT) superfamily [Orrella dioscoreae]
MRTHLRLLGMAILWGASWSWGRYVAQTMPPIGAASVRFLIASAALLLWLTHSGRLDTLTRLNRRQWTGLFWASAAGVCGYSVFFMLGLQLVPASKGAVVITINPAVTLLLAALIFGEKLNGKIVLGMLMAVGGALFAISNGSLLQLLTGQTGIGELLLLGCVACWVAYTLIGRAVLGGVDALTATTVTALMGALMLLAVSLVTEGGTGWSAMLNAGGDSWFYLLLLGVGSTAIAYAWFFEGVKTLGAGAAAGYITLVPVFGILVSSAWLDEPLTASLLIGGGIAIAGMTVMQLGRQAPKASRG